LDRREEAKGKRKLSPVGKGNASPAERENVSLVGKWK
jgi:hypothetical protein